MSVDAILRDAKTLRGASVSKGGALAVGPVEDDEREFNNLNVINTAFNFYSPRANQVFIITGIIAFADKDISDASSTVIAVYGALSAASITVEGQPFQFGMGKLTLFPGLPLRFKIGEGLFVNAKTDDNNILMTILGHYEKA